MNIILAFAPFLVFAALDRWLGATGGLVGGALTAAILLLRQMMARDGKIKVLEVGTLVLFGALAGYTVIRNVEWSIVSVRLWVDGGLLLIVLISLMIRQPFTLQYAREKAPKEKWHEPEFVRRNYIITAVWAGAFGIMVAADLVMVFLPGVPLQIGIATTVVAMVAAVRFTSWYPKQRG